MLGWFLLLMQADVDGPRAWAIDWTAPAACPDGPAVEAKIASYVAAEPGDATAVRAQATVRVVAEGFEITLVVVGDEAATRVWKEASCEVLADAVAVVVAFAIEPVALPEPAPTPEPTPTQETPLPAAEPAAPADQPRSMVPAEGDATRRPLEFGLGVHGGYGSAIAPIGSGLVGVALAVGRARWALEVDGRLWVPRTFEDDTGGYGARVLLGTVGVAGCLRPPTRRVEVPLCVGVEAGSQRVDGRGVLEARTRQYPWIAPRLRVGLRIPLGRSLGLRFAIEGAVPLVRAGIDVRGAERLWATQAVSLRALAGLDLRWIR